MVERVRVLFGLQNVCQVLQDVKKVVFFRPCRLAEISELRVFMEDLQVSVVRLFFKGTSLMAGDRIWLRIWWSGWIGFGVGLFLFIIGLKEQFFSSLSMIIFFLY